MTRKIPAPGENAPFAFIIIATVAATFALTAFSIPASAAEANSSGYRVLNQIFDSGGQLVNDSATRTFTSVTEFAGTTNVTNVFVCAGYVCFTLEQLGGVQTTVTLLLNFNISGIAGDAAYVDTLGFGFFRAADLSKYAACVEDTGIASTPTFGIVSSGQQLNYIELQNSTSSFILRVSEFQQDNRFLLPVTTGGCAGVRGKLPLNALIPFVSTGEVVDAIELFLSYPFTDIAGTAERSGRLTLVLEKNDTNQIAVDVI